MTPSGLTFLGGLLMGLASSLHCAGMCGAIASSLMFAFDPGKGTAGRAQALAAAQLGRIVMYVAAGTALGGAGASLYGVFDHAAAHFVLRWAAAVSLGWIGLSIAGWAPSLAGLDRIAAPTARFLHAAGGPARPGQGAFACGLLWGALPCGMVYGALFYALLAGSAAGGAAVMAGFGLGTLPAVTSLALGVAGLRRFAAVPGARRAAGVAIMTLAGASVAAPALATALCLR